MAFYSVNFNFFNQINSEACLTAFEQILSATKKKCIRLLKKISYDDEPETFDVKFVLIEENFEKIIRSFEEFEDEKINFIESLPTWSHARRMNIFQLRTHAREIARDRWNCNYTKAGAFSVGIIGGAVGVFALIFPSSARSLTTVGLITVGISGVTTVGTSITELVLLHKCMNQVKTVQEIDEDNFKPMTQWFEHTEELRALLDHMRGFSVAKEMFQDLKDCKTSINNILLNKDGKLHPLLKKVLDRGLDKLAEAGKKKALIALLFFAILLHRKNNLMLSCLVVAHRLILCAMKISGLGSGLGMAISNIAMKSRAATTKEISTAAAKVIAQGFMFGLGLGLDITNLAIISKDICKGSNSKKADDINTIAEGLESELEALESIYKKLGGEAFEQLPIN